MRRKHPCTVHRAPCTMNAPRPASRLSLAPPGGLCFSLFSSLETGEAGPLAAGISRGKVGEIPLFFVPCARVPVTP
jgi:hypothetical protein